MRARWPASRTRRPSSRRMVSRSENSATGGEAMGVPILWAPGSGLQVTGDGPGIGSKLQVMRVLVVEDERKVADALHDGLEREGFQVVVERTGEGAFFRVTTETFDVVLLDLGLPLRGGIEILSA